MPEDRKESIKESLLANAPKSTWRAMNFAIYTFSFVLFFLVGCVFILVLKTSVVTINLSAAKTEYFKDKAKVGKANDLLTKMEEVLTRPYLIAEEPHVTSSASMSRTEDPAPLEIDGSGAEVGSGETRPTPTPVVIELDGDSFMPPPASDRRQERVDPRERDIKELRQEIQELQKDDVTPSDILQKF